MSPARGRRRLRPRRLRQSTVEAFERISKGFGAWFTSEQRGTSRSTMGAAAWAPGDGDLPAMRARVSLSERVSGSDGFGEQDLLTLTGTARSVPSATRSAG